MLQGDGPHPQDILDGLDDVVARVDGERGVYKLSLGRNDGLGAKQNGEGGDV
jgi:hypothetical protein